jgi:hypothetical protein
MTIVGIVVLPHGHTPDNRALWLFWPSSVLLFGSLEPARPFSCLLEGADLGLSAYPAYSVAPALTAVESLIKPVKRLKSRREGVQLDALAVSNPDCAIPTM